MIQRKKDILTKELKYVGTIDTYEHIGLKRKEQSQNPGLAKFRRKQKNLSLFQVK